MQALTVFYIIYSSLTHVSTLKFSICGEWKGLDTSYMTLLCSLTEYWVEFGLKKKKKTILKAGPKLAVTGEVSNIDYLITKPPRTYLSVDTWIG